MNIQDILNKKDATRNMTIEEFELELPNLAKQLSKISIIPNYSEKELREDWKKLCYYENENPFTSSVVRPGAKLCESFFPNFWNIKNSKGQCFMDFWTPEKLEKILRWNRSAHSTPYLSELKRGVYFCYGLTKNTMYRPHLAKMICDYYKPKIVLDPCCGWGGRMLGCVAAGATYIGFEPNIETYSNLLSLAKFLGITDKIQLYNLGAENISSIITTKVDLILTSPPYFNLEIYSNAATQSENMFSNYNSWSDQWLFEVIKQSLEKLNENGISCWNTQNIKGMLIFDDVIKYHKILGYEENKCFGLSSSARPTNKKINDDKKTENITMCFSKLDIS